MLVISLKMGKADCKMMCILNPTLKLDTEVHVCTEKSLKDKWRSVWSCSVFMMEKLHGRIFVAPICVRS
jgi:hypothetical protein